MQFYQALHIRMIFPKSLSLVASCVNLAATEVNVRLAASQPPRRPGRRPGGDRP